MTVSFCRRLGKTELIRRQGPSSYLNQVWPALADIGMKPDGHTSVFASAECVCVTWDKAPATGMLASGTDTLFYSLAAANVNCK